MPPKILVTDQLKNYQISGRTSRSDQLFLVKTFHDRLNNYKTGKIHSIILLLFLERVIAWVYEMLFTYDYMHNILYTTSKGN